MQQFVQVGRSVYHTRLRAVLAFVYVLHRMPAIHAGLLLPSNIFCWVQQPSRYLTVHQTHHPTKYDE